MKKIIFSMIIGGGIGYILAKQQSKIALLKKDFENSKDAYLRGVSEGLKERCKRAQSRTSYTSYYGRRYKNEDIIIETRGEAEEILSHLENLIKEYTCASVTDLHDLVGLSSSFINNQYGWTDLKDASVTQTRHGYMLNLPKPQKLT